MLATWGTSTGRNPTLDLQFAGATSLDNRITFSRGTTATYFNSAGVLTTAGTSEARFDYNPSTLAAQGLLIEEQRTNLLLQSQDFATSWTNADTIITTDSAVAPNNTSTADKLIATIAVVVGGGAHYIISSSTAMTAGIVYTGSVFAKAAERTTLQLTFQGATHGSTYFANFNLANGTLGTSGGAGVSSAISAVGNGWYRCSISAPATTTASGGLVIVTSTSTSASRLPIFTGDDVSGIFIWGAQLEAGAFATSYIPTTTTALTRNADVASMTGTNFSSWYNASEGVLYSQSQQYADRTGGFPVVTGVTDSGDGQNCIEHYWGNSTSSFGGIVYVSSAIQASLSTSGLTRTAVQKYAFAYKANDFASSLNGAAVSTDGSGTIPVVDRLIIGGRPTGSRYSGYIQRIAYYPVRLQASQLQALTA